MSKAISSDSQILNLDKTSTEWQDNCFDLYSRLKYILENDKWTDCVLLVGFESNKREILAHKLLLAMASPVLARQFFGSVPFQGDPINIPDVDADAFYAMIKFIYTDKIDFESVEVACNVWIVADKYLVLSLVEHCLQYIWDNICFENALVISKHAELLNQQSLRKECLKIIFFNVTEFFKHPSFLEIDPDFLLTLFQDNHLNINSEIELFDALTDYCNKHQLFLETCTSQEILDVSLGQKQQKDYSKETADEMKSRKVKHEQLVRKALKEIRFLTMSAEQFRGPLSSNLLSEREKLAFISNILKVTKYDVPQGFSVIRSVRTKTSTPEDLTKKKLFTQDITMSISSNPSKNTSSKTWVTFKTNRPIWIAGVELKTQISNFVVVNVSSENNLSLTNGFSCPKSQNNMYYDSTDYFGIKIYFHKPALLQPFSNYTISEEIRINSCYDCTHYYQSKCKTEDNYKISGSNTDIEFTLSNISDNCPIRQIYFCYPFTK